MPGRIDTFFKLSERHSNKTREFFGGLANFFATAYILFLNPHIFSQAIVSGKPISPDSILSMTALTAGTLTLVGMGIVARYPFVVAPGLGLNIFLVAGVINGLKVPWETALGIVFWEGILGVAVVLIFGRKRIIDWLPDDLKRAISVGIGILIARASIPVGHIPLGNIVVIIIGLATIALLWAQLKKWGPLFCGMVLSTIVAYVLNRLGVEFSDGTGPSALGKIFPQLPNMEAAFRVDIMGALNVAFLPLILAFMLSDLFDSISTLDAMGDIRTNKSTFNAHTDFANDQKGQRRALAMDSIGPALGGVTGASASTTFLESGIGIANGARTGLASLITGSLLLATMFFGPVAAIIPRAATTPALLFLGYLFFINIRKVNFTEEGDIPTQLAASVIILMIPFTQNIATGIAYGITVYTFATILVHRSLRRPSTATYVFTAILVTYLIFLSLSGL